MTSLIQKSRSIMLKFQFWAFENGDIKHMVGLKFFRVYLPRPRGQKAKKKFLKMVVLEKVARERYLKSVSTLLDP